jgi:glutamine amidotransferase
MICVVDYGLGNIGSLVNMCCSLGIETIIGNDRPSFNKATHLILPGVGTFDKAISNLKSDGLFNLLDEVVINEQKPILGLCLGAQVMLGNSEEGTTKGFGWVPGEVVRFQLPHQYKIPHMGWNEVFHLGAGGLFNDMPDSKPRFYFVHSYFFSGLPEQYVACKTEYGKEFVSGFRKGNIVGLQFHPEKSHQFGIQLLRNFYAIK